MRFVFASSLLEDEGADNVLEYFVEYFQHRNIEELYLNDASWYAQQAPDCFAFHIGEQVRLQELRSSGQGKELTGLSTLQVTSIDTASKTVHTSKGNTFEYVVSSWFAVGSC